MEDELLNDSEEVSTPYIPPLSPDPEDLEEEGRDAEIVNTVEVETDVLSTTKKKRGKGKKSNFVWLDEVTAELINEWRQESVLYNVKDQDYSNKGQTRCCNATNSRQDGGKRHYPPTN